MAAGVAVRISVGMAGTEGGLVGVFGGETFPVPASFRRFGEGGEMVAQLAALSEEAGTDATDRFLLDNRSKTERKKKELPSVGSVSTE